LVCKEAENQVKLLQELIVQIRSIKSDYNLMSSKNLVVILKTEDENIEKLIDEEKEVIKFLARIEDIKCVKIYERKQGEVSVVLSFGEVFVDLSDLIDIKKEIERLEKEKAKILKKLELTNKKLSNKDFIEKAPKEVVEKEMNLKKELESKLTKIEKHLSFLR